MPAADYADDQVTNVTNITTVTNVTALASLPCEARITVANGSRMTTSAVRTGTRALIQGDVVVDVPQALRRKRGPIQRPARFAAACLQAIRGSTACGLAPVGPPLLEEVAMDTRNFKLACAAVNHRVAGPPAHAETVVPMQGQTPRTAARSVRFLLHVCAPTTSQVSASPKNPDAVDDVQRPAPAQFRPTRGRR